MRRSEKIPGWSTMWVTGLGYAVVTLGALALTLCARALAGGLSPTGDAALPSLQSALYGALSYATAAAVIGSAMVLALDGRGSVRRSSAALILGGALALGAVQVLIALIPSRM